MANAAIKITVGALLDGGDYDSVIGGATVPDIATILTDITTALGNAGGSFDSTNDITAIQTDAVALTGAIDSDVAVVWDGAVVTNRRQLRAALELALKAVDAGYGGLDE